MSKTSRTTKRWPSVSIRPIVSTESTECTSSAELCCLTNAFVSLVEAEPRVCSSKSHCSSSTLRCKWRSQASMRWICRRLSVDSQVFSPDSLTFWKVLATDWFVCKIRPMIRTLRRLALTWPRWGRTDTTANTSDLSSKNPLTESENSIKTHYKIYLRDSQSFILIICCKNWLILPKNSKYFFLSSFLFIKNSKQKQKIIKLLLFNWTGLRSWKGPAPATS